MSAESVDPKLRTRMTAEQDPSLAPLEVQSNKRRMDSFVGGAATVKVPATISGNTMAIKGVTMADLDAMEAPLVTEDNPPGITPPTPRRADSLDAGPLLNKLVLEGANAKRITFNLAGFKFTFQASMVSLTDSALLFFLHKKALSFELKYLEAFEATVDKVDVQLMYAGGYAEYPGMDFAIFTFIRTPKEESHA